MIAAYCSALQRPEFRRDWTVSAKIPLPAICRASAKKVSQAIWSLAPMNQFSGGVGMDSPAAMIAHVAPQNLARKDVPRHKILVIRGISGNSYY